ncbi:hypothetical protein M3685_24725 [Heyndrickxia oleronia]|uniref:hypothetical protein n=1 Tax=Heyndrickxia oleronia TaxID=38875 RepID=UPI002040459F|nr:hypothetical protein [Heyndrickxia oleronia]MCM3457092.1 hypothetical protein [Heyndrickxia oleronia]
MKIIDTIPFFMNNYHPSIRFLRSYYNEYPDIFQEYLAYHCKDTDERHSQSIKKYPQFFSRINQVHQNIKPIIKEIDEKYSDMYQLTFPIEVNLLVGGFGSNAYTHRQIIPNISFALERLSPSPDHLRTIVAHEFGHVAHNILSDMSGMDWSKLNWNNPLIWLHQEGVAIHFSRKTAKNLNPSMYFSFNDEGNDWLTYAKAHKHEIKMAFAHDYAIHSPQQIFQEWFSINGGRTFGYSRFGYFISDMFFQHQINQLGEKNAIIAWTHTDNEGQTEKWLLENVM